MQYRAAITPLRDVLNQYRVVKRLSAVFDVTLGPLGLITAGLLIVELLASLSSPWDTIVFGAQIATWVVFLVAFVIEMSLAPKKLVYLHRNWLLVLALVIPALRIFRVAQAVRVLQSGRVVRGASLVRGFTSSKRGVEAIEGFLGFRQTAFMAALTGIV